MASMGYAQVMSARRLPARHRGHKALRAPAQSVSQCCRQQHSALLQGLADSRAAPPPPPVLVSAACHRVVPGGQQPQGHADGVADAGGAQHGAEAGLLCVGGQGVGQRMPRPLPACHAQRQGSSCTCLHRCGSSKAEVKGTAQHGLPWPAVCWVECVEPGQQPGLPARRIPGAARSGGGCAGHHAHPGAAWCGMRGRGMRGECCCSCITSSDGSARPAWLARIQAWCVPGRGMQPSACAHAPPPPCGCPASRRTARGCG